MSEEVPVCPHCDEYMEEACEYSYEDGEEFVHNCEHCDSNVKLRARVAFEVLT